MPIKDYDLRLYGRRRCRNCFWYEQGVCFFISTDNYLHETEKDSWCPDWNSRRIENQEGQFLSNTPGYEQINSLRQIENK